MFSKDEASKLKQQFWITFGKYMKPVPNAEGMLINWVNYKTGVKHIIFKLDAEQKFACIAIEIAHPDVGVRELLFQQLEEFKKMLEGELGETWSWKPVATNPSGQSIARIEKVIEPVSVYNQQHWADIIAFFKPRIMALDQFWIDVKPVFEELK